MPENGKISRQGNLSLLQYFISTHNPYLLLAILEKAPKKAVNVLVTYLEDYQTRVKVLSEEEISVLMDAIGTQDSEISTIKEWLKQALN